LSKRPYRVSVLGGGRKSFTNLDSAVAFAASQARASWAQQDWTVWDVSQPDGEPKWIGGALNPRHGLGVCVRIVSVDGVAVDPFAPAEYIDLRR
jgi:hypothetical protein